MPCTLLSGRAACEEATASTQAAQVLTGSSSSSSSPFAVGISEAVFQLRYCGDVLQRDAPDVLDPRVASFNPDLWQRKVLDAIDAGNSCVSPS